MLSLDKSHEASTPDESALDYQFKLVRRRTIVLLSVVTFASLAVFGWIYQRTKALTFQQQLVDHRRQVSELESRSAVLEAHSSELSVEIGRLAFIKSALDSVNQGQRVELSTVRDSVLAIAAALQGRNQRINSLLAYVRADSISIARLESDTVRLQTMIQQLNNTIRNLDSARSSLNGEVARLQEQASGLRARADTAGSKVAQLEQDTATLSGRVQRLEQLLQTRSDELSGARNEISVLEKDTAHLREQLRQRPSVETNTGRDTTPQSSQRRRR